MSAVEHKQASELLRQLVTRGELRDVDRVPGDEDEGRLGHRHGAAEDDLPLMLLVLEGRRVVNERRRPAASSSTSGGLLALRPPPG